MAQDHFKQRPARKAWKGILGYHPNEEALEEDWPCHPPRNLLFKDCLALHSREKAKEGSSKEHMATDGGERNVTDGKDLEQHLSHDEGPA